MTRETRGKAGGVKPPLQSEFELERQQEEAAKREKSIPRAGRMPALPRLGDYLEADGGAHLLRKAKMSSGAMERAASNSPRF